MKKILKSAITLLSLVAFTLPTACNTGNGAVEQPQPLTETDISVWGCPATEKILADMSKENYADIATDAKIDIFMAKGEYESGQLIISPSEDVSYYDARISDLTLQGGTAKIAKEDIAVYAEKYLNVGVNYNNNGAPLGDYPDGLVPVSSIVEYKQNTIEANTNQGIYVTFETALDQAAGVYTGNLILDFKDFTKTVPVSVRVYDLEVSEKVRSKSVFLSHWAYEHGELNSTQEMYDTYTQALIDYRLAPSKVLFENNHNEDSIRRYVEKSYEFLINPRCSNVSIPYKEITKKHTDGNNYVCMDPTTLEAYLYAFVEKSIQENFNLIEKLVFYNATIDEAKIMGRPEGQVALNNTVWNQTIKKVAAAIESDGEPTEFKMELAESIRNIPYIVTTDYWETFADPNSDTYANVFCPMTDYLNSAASRAEYDNLLEKWWYTCNLPYYPQSNYHIDFTSTVPIRAMGWEQADYGYVGTLYWAVNYYANTVNGDRKFFDEDYYGGSANKMQYGNSAAGDGRLFYPGGQYGLDHPLPSLRLEAIRDGLEEYELILSLKEKYQQFGFSADSLISTLGETIYSGTQVTATVDEFSRARETLFELCSAANSSAEMCIIESKDDSNGSIDYKVYINEGYALTCDGKTLTGGEAHGNGVIYTVSKKLDQASNTISFAFTADGKEYSYTQSLGGKVKLVTAEQIVGGFERLSEKLELNASVVDSAVKVEVGATENATQWFQFTHNEISALDGSMQKVSFVIRNDGEEEIPLTVSAEYSKAVGQLVSVATLDLKQGVNVVTVYVDTVAWAKVGKINRLLFKLGDTENENEKTVYFEKMLVYGK